MSLRRGLKVAAGCSALALVALYVLAIFRDGRGAQDGASTAGPLQLSGTPVEQGRYLAAAANCTSCHTRPGGAPYAGGVAFRMPIGTVYSANITPDAETGIGAWSEEDFLRAVRSGVARGGRHLYPAHPYTSYAAMARDDALAILAYLRSLAPVHAATPRAELSFPFSQRWLLPAWNLFYLRDARFAPDARHDAGWNRGAYLATALGHCGECHTPRNLAYAMQPGKALQGAVLQGWKAYDITGERHSGIGAWGAAALAEYLRSGHAAGHGTAAGPMREVIDDSTSHLAEGDRAALVAYLMAGGEPGEGAAVPAAASAVTPTAAMAGTAGDGGAAGASTTGATLYAGTCAGCHPLEPSVAPGAFSDLRGAHTVRDPEATNLLRILAQGSAHGASSAVSMPQFSSDYSDSERAAIANFVLARWGDAPAAVNANDARRARLAQ